MRSFTGCNLTTIDVSDVRSQEDLNERVRSAAFIGTLQASYTDFPYLRHQWQKEMEKDYLLGVSMTGIASNEIFDLSLEEAAEIVMTENARIAALIGTKPAARTTLVKPEGTVSLVAGTSSGVHAWHSNYYMRRIRINRNEALYTYLSIYHPELLEEDLRDSKVSIIRIPQKAPAGATTLENETAINLLERIRYMHDNWIKPGHRRGDNTHNVSATVTLKKDEWDQAKNWMWNNRNSYTALSIFPADEHTYVQTPFESCTKEEYENLLSSLKEIDLTKVVEVEDITKHNDTVACGGGACEIK